MNKNWINTILAIGLSGLVMACNDQPSNQPKIPIPTLTVDTTLKPARATLPAIDDSGPRPIVTMLDSEGNKTDFIENELVISTEDTTKLGAFLTRWQGKVLQTIDPATQGLSGFKPMYLVRVNVANADTSKLGADLQSLTPDSTGASTVSSSNGEHLLAAATSEAKNASVGMGVGINWVSQGSSIRDQTTQEAATGPTGYNPSAFQWNYMDAGSTQDIGVVQAWRALELAGKLKNRVKIGILDMGFQPNSDFPTGWVATSNVPLRLPIGTENLLGCSGGNPCPWHGTSVAEAAAGVADNNFGAAGPAGPVADLVLVYTSYDYFTSIGAMIQARIGGAKIMNMSYGAPIPWYLAWSILPFEVATKAMRLSGTLLFAAAGNDGKDVDSEGCTLSVCFERTWWTPCENAGVICVGGLEENSLSRAQQSNYGDDQVDIFAPFTVFVGPDPEHPENKARRISGTSFSSPFAAGVAALIWAANPSLSANQVEDIMLETAHVGKREHVKKYLDANAAVHRALGNVQPRATISGFGGDVQINRSTHFEALLEDFEDAQACCAATWTSSVDGALGSTTSLFSSVDKTFTTLGPRTITVTIQDSGGLSSTASIFINVVNTPPAVQITAPTVNSNLFRSLNSRLRAFSYDPNELNDELNCSRMQWTSSNPADPFPQMGCDLRVVFASEGSRTLTLTGTDSQNASATQTVSVNVVAPPTNLPPVVNLTSPKNGSIPDQLGNILLVGSADDPEKTATTLKWEANWPLDPRTGQLGPNTRTLTPNASNKVNIFDVINQAGEYNFQVRITLKATDAQGNVDEDSVIIQVSRIL